jgi:hypothetical protein
MHLLLRYLVGLREEEVDRLTVRPVLPQALRHVGASYRVEPVPWGKYALSVECTVADAGRYRLRLRCVVPATEEELEIAQEEAAPQETEAYECEWEGGWGEGRTLLLPQLTIASV